MTYRARMLGRVLPRKPSVMTKSNKVNKIRNQFSCSFPVRMQPIIFKKFQKEVANKTKFGGSCKTSTVEVTAIAPGSFTNLMIESPTIKISGHSVSGFPL